MAGEVARLRAVARPAQCFGQRSGCSCQALLACGLLGHTEIVLCNFFLDVTHELKLQSDLSHLGANTHTVAGFDRKLLVHTGSPQEAPQRL